MTSLVRFEKKLSYFENALAYSNAGVEVVSGCQDEL
jgi:hypothetical protein